MQKFEGAPGEFKGALGSRQPLISSSAFLPIYITKAIKTTSIFSQEFYIALLTGKCLEKVFFCINKYTAELIGVENIDYLDSIPKLLIWFN